MDSLAQKLNMNFHLVKIVCVKFGLSSWCKTERTQRVVTLRTYINIITSDKVGKL